MIRLLAPLFILAAALPLQAQGAPPQEDIRKVIIDRVKARLDLEHKRILEKVAQIIDEELSGKGPQPKAPESEADRKIAELQRKLDDLDKAKRDLKKQIDQLKKDLAGSPTVEDGEDKIKAEAKAKGPQDLQEAQELFDEANEDHNAKNFKESIRKFKWIFYQFPTNAQIGAPSAYNVACGYSLNGDKAKACEWLATSIKAGFRDYEHIRKDTDLDNIRDEKRYKELLADK